MKYVISAIMGLAFGSFVNAAVWRLHEKTKLSKKASAAQLKKLSIVSGRSMCPYCRHELSWKDLLPVISWIWLKGRCRYCRKKISAQYPFIEVVTLAGVVVSAWQWPFALHTAVDYCQFFVWTLCIACFMILSVYDFWWRELPTSVIRILTLLTVLFVCLQIGGGDITMRSALGTYAFGSLLIGGFFWLLYQISNGKWIGGGDVRFAFFIGLLLGWQRGLLAVGIASLMGTVLALILVVQGKFHRRMEVPFGPFLIFGVYSSFLWGEKVIEWYLHLAGL